MMAHEFSFKDLHELPRSKLDIQSPTCDTKCELPRASSVPTPFKLCCEAPGDLGGDGPIRGISTEPDILAVMLQSAGSDLSTPTLAPCNLPNWMVYTRPLKSGISKESYICTATTLVSPRSSLIATDLTGLDEAPSMAGLVGRQHSSWSAFILNNLVQHTDERQQAGPTYFAPPVNRSATCPGLMPEDSCLDVKSADSSQPARRASTWNHDLPHDLPLGRVPAAARRSRLLSFGTRLSAALTRPFMDAPGISHSTSSQAVSLHRWGADDDELINTLEMNCRTAGAGYKMCGTTDRRSSSTSRSARTITLGSLGRWFASVSSARGSSNGNKQDKDCMESNAISQPLPQLQMEERAPVKPRTALFSRLADTFKS